MSRRAIRQTAALLAATAATTASAGFGDDLFENPPDAIVYVDEDSNGCRAIPETITPIYSTIQQAIDLAPAETPTRIEVWCGSYFENIDFGGKPITLYALDGPGYTTIRAADSALPAVRCADGASADTALIGFFVRDSGSPGANGGAMVVDGASPSILGCKFEENEAFVGGALSVRNGDPLIVNCTFWSNVAGNGGGAIFLENADPEIVNCTFAKNQCWKSEGGAIRGIAGSDPLIRNSIFWSDFSVFGAPFNEIYGDTTSFPVVEQCIVMDGWFGFGSNNDASDPEFRDIEFADLRLLDTSPAIDAADAAYLPADDYDLDLDNDSAEPTPIDGFMRLRRWDGPPAATFPPPLDRGAHEWTPYDTQAGPVKRSELGRRLWALDADGKTVYLPYSSSQDLFVDDENIRRVVFSIPSSGRGANHTVRQIGDPTFDEGLSHETLIIAPQFLERRDLGLGSYGFLGTDVVYWSSGWNQAGLSTDGIADGPEAPYGPYGERPATVPSFTFVDDMIRHVVNSGLYPNLETIVVTGHSGGGQFSQRYALSSPIEDTVVRPRGIDMRYVPTSPGRLTFVSIWRPVDDYTVNLRKAVAPELEVPIGECPDDPFDAWPWGLSSDFNTYHYDNLGETDEEVAAAMRSQYERRAVTLLIDECDNNPAHEQLPMECGAQLQGLHRFDRAQNFFAAVVQTYGPQILSRHRLAIIDEGGCPPGGRHSSFYNYDSDMGRRWVLGADSTPTFGPFDRTLRVDPDVPTGVTPDGRSWGAAFRNLQDACLAAAAWGGDVTQIWVADGTYRPDRTLAEPDGTGDRQWSFPIMEGIAVLGGFSGLSGANEQFDYERDPDANVCVLSGDLSGDSPGSITDDAFHVVTGHLIDACDYIDGLELDDPVGPDPPQVFTDFTGAIDGFTIRHGNADDDGDPPFTYTALDTFRRGGGVHIVRGAPIIQDCIIEDCYAFNGGGISSEGCIAADDEFPCLLDVFHDYGEGARIVDCDIRDNTVLLNGAGIYLYSSSPYIIGSRIRNNTAGIAGGGIGAFGELGDFLPRIEGCRITGNDGGGLGGGMTLQTEGAIVSNTLFRDNAADDDGGAIQTTLQKTSEGYFTNLTIVDNAVSSGGRGAGYYGAGAGLGFIENCVFASNTGSTLEIQGAATTIAYTRADDLYLGDGNITGDPQFVDDAGNDFHLAPGSPCIDAADNRRVQVDAPDVDGDGDVDEAAPFDLDAGPRFQDDAGTLDTGVPGQGYDEIVDMGAYEFGGASCTPDLDGDGIVGVGDLLGVLGSWGGPGGDVTGDGITDIADLLGVLGGWGSCP